MLSSVIPEPLFWRRRLRIHVKIATILCCLSAAARGQGPAPSSLDVPVRLTLAAASDILLARNPSLLRERQNIAIARANVYEATLRPNPELEVSSESYPLFEANPGSFFNRQELVVRAGQTIETAGKRAKRTAVAEQELAVTESSLQDVIRQLKLELKTKYFAVVLAKAQYALARELLSDYDRVLRINDIRYKQGEISGFDWNRLQTERLRFFNDVIDSELQMKNAKLAVLEILGSRSAMEFDVTESLTFAPVQGSLESLEQEVEQTRPDLLAERSRLERENRSVVLQKAIAVPNFVSTFGYKRDFSQNTVAFGLTVPLPLFNRNQAGVARADAELQQRRYELERVRLAVHRDVEQAYNSVETQVQRVLAIQQTYLPSAQRARDIAQTSFQLGALDLVSFLDAQRSYRETLRTSNQAVFDEESQSLRSKPPSARSSSD